MKGFCISLDVSKGSSFYQGFKGLDEPITKPKKIEHIHLRKGFETMDVQLLENSNISRIKKCPNFNFLF